MLLCFLAIGLAGRELVHRAAGYEIKRPESVLMVGIVIITLYAEAFSIFYKLGAAAFLLLLFLVLLIFLKSSSSIINYIKDLWASQTKRDKICFIAVIISISFFASFLTASIPVGYDTYNYHAPAVRWLEEYGIVKGLGNLHTRFAYNSSFSCLQALFSFKWLLGISMHSLNGFIWLFSALYCILTFKLHYKSLALSNLLKILFMMLLLSYDTLAGIASPGTDFMPLCLTAFIFIKYCELNETDETNYVPYALLAMLGFFSATVKLSAAAAGVFALKPVYDMIKKREYKAIINFILLSFIIILPFVIRNIIISGYIVYPFPAIDLFNFDLKIPKFVAVSDSIAIKVFARTWGTQANCDYYYNISFFEWFITWLRGGGRYYAALTAANIILLPLSFIWIIYFTLKKINYRYDKTILFAAASGFIFLMLTAPALRFGIIYLYIMPLFFIYAAADFLRVKIIFDKNRMTLAASAIMSLAFIAFPIAFVKYLEVRPLISNHNYQLMSFIPNDYDDDNSKKDFVEINGYKFYYFSSQPDILLLNGYYGFPGTETKYTLERIEMRGPDLKDGFRVRDEYKNKPYDFQGRLLKDGEIIY